MTQPNQSELDNLVQILGKYHDAEPHRYLEAADIVAYITANYTANSEIAEREQSLWAITYDFLHGVDRGLCDEWERVIAERAKLKEVK